MNIAVYRKNVKVEDLSLISAIFNKRLMAEHDLVFTIKDSKTLNLQVGDYVTYKGEVMTINKQPEIKRSDVLDYVIVFQGERHTLSRFLIKDEGALVFDYSDALDTYMFMFLESINSVDSGWSIGELETVEPFTVTFDKVDHLTALNMIAEACKCEWQIKNKVITVKKTVGQARNYPLRYGKDKGLYSIQRTSLENAKIVTRAFAVGGSQNLPASYKYKQLTLQGFEQNDEAVDIFGVREGVIEDQEIYPRLINATVKNAVKVDDKRYSITTDLDFDLNGQRIDGQEMYVVFKSGMLTGRQFKILDYNHTSKIIRYEVIKDDNGNTYPSGVSIAEIGDKYILIGIRMPQSYVTAALEELQAKRTEYLNSNKVPRVVYKAPLDPLDLKRKNTVIDEGDILPFIDEKIGLNDNLRVTAISYPACFPEILFKGMVFTAEIGQEVTYTRAQKIEKDIKENKEVITQTTKRSYENDRISAMRMRQLQELVFDPEDGYFDGSKIKPNSIETLMLSVGAKSQNFLLNGVRINVNHNDQASKVLITAGQLVHLEVKIDGVGYIWNMAQLLKEDLDPIKAYYLSARCSRSQLTGTWMLSEVPINTESEAGYYHFNVGVIYSEFENKRDYSFTNGMTYINGANIKTGKISADRLDVNEIVVNGGGATVEQMNSSLQDTLNASKAYSEAQSELAKVTASAYADGIVSAEEQARIADAQAKLEAAKAYSEAQSELAKVTASAYADGIVTAEELARIEDAQAKLTEAKNHANTVSNSALENSKDYTDGKIDGLGDLAHEDLVELAKLGSTIISGGYIKADLIDVIALFAQQITATNLKVTGDSQVGVFSLLEDGLFVGSDPVGGLYTKQVSILRNGMHLLYGEQGLNNAGIDMYSNAAVLARIFNSGLATKNIGHQYDMGTNNTAIDIVSGQIRVNNKLGATEKFAVSVSGSTKYMNFENGVFVGLTTA